MSNSVQPFFLTDQFSWNSFCPAGKHKAHGLYFILQLHTLLGERSRVERNREQERGARKRCKDARKRCKEVERGRDARKMFMEEIQERRSNKELQGRGPKNRCKEEIHGREAR